EVHTEIGHRCVGAKVNGKMVPLSYQLKSGDIVEVLTAKRERGPSRDWLAVVKTTRARNKIKQWFKQESREDTEHSGRSLLQEHRRAAQGPGAVRARALGGRPRDGVQGRAAGRRMGSPPAPGGPVADVRRVGDQHRRGALHRLAADGAESLRGRGRRHPLAE